MLRPKQAPVELSPERTALRVAIGERDRAAARLAALRDRCEGWSSPAVQAVRQAEQALRDAHEAEEQAARDRAADAVAVALGGAPLAAMTAAEARVAVQAAESCLADAQRDRAALVAAIEPATNDLEGRRIDVRRAAEAVIVAEVAPRADAIAARYHELQRELRRMETALRWLAVMKVMPDRGMLHSDLMRIDGAQPWRGVMDSLQADATAPLPAIGG